MTTCYECGGQCGGPMLLGYEHKCKGPEMNSFLKACAILLVGGLIGGVIVYVWVACMLAEAFNR